MSEKKKILLSAVLGNGLEFYDFALFSAFTIQFSHLFFAPFSKGALLQTLMIFGIGFFARPLGAVFFGNIGDRVGRKKALGLSIVLMGAATFLIGCLPTYQSIGWIAPVFLLIFRCLQGFCLGGENNGSAIFFIEHLKEKKALAGALILTGGSIGTLLATSFSALTMMHGMPAYAWRVPFIAGLFVGILGLYIRKTLPETKDFLACAKKEAPVPLSEVWQKHRYRFIATVGIGGVNGALAYTVVAYLYIYMNQVAHADLAKSLWTTCFGISLFGILAPIMGYLADKFSPRSVMQKACFGIMIGAFPLFYILHLGSFGGFFVGTVMASVMMAGFNGPSNAYLNCLFPVRCRYKAIALGYALGAALMGGMAPSIYTYCIDFLKTPFAPCLYLFFVGGIGLISLALVDTKTHLYD